ncbi:hypothetical protein GCM10022261_05070 [Brevibacterium daeguense]|uniref:UspA domain-containing protein n=1 Tax=Brevibacterium daeguense TaxID=909936 RepID=A0ABP8EGK2_9MICO
MTAFAGPVPDSGGGRWSNAYRQAVSEAVDSVVSGLLERAEDAGVDATARTVEGDAGGVLVQASRSARLMVVGRHGRNRFAGRFLGSVFGKLASHSRCPTLVVPETRHSSSARAPAPEQEQEQAHTGAHDDEHFALLAESGQRSPERRPCTNVHPVMSFDPEVVAGIDVGDSGLPVALQAAEAARALGRPLTLVSAAPLNVEGHWFPNPVEYSFGIPVIQARFTGRSSSCRWGRTITAIRLV